MIVGNFIQNLVLLIDDELYCKLIRCILKYLVKNLYCIKYDCLL